MNQGLSTISDEELARRAQAGSLDAFEQLVFRYENRVYAFVLQICRNATDAREATQDTFVKAFQSIEQFDKRRAFAPWLFTIARRKCIDRHRAAPRDTDAVMPELVDHTNPSELAAQRDEGRNLWQLARERLTENQFQALWLHYAEDMDIAQIAQTLRKTRVHIKVMLFRARQILARELNPHAGLEKPGAAANTKPVLTVLAATLNPHIGKMTGSKKTL